MTTNIILMAGKGTRFIEKGYKISKPLLPVSGQPMIVRAARSLPKAKKWVFVVRQEHLVDQKLIAVLKSTGENVDIIADPNPIGQLNSCLVAEDYYPDKDYMFVGACDFEMSYNEKKLFNLIKKEEPDMISFSFTKQKNLSRNPVAWGWLKLGEKNRITGVSVKVPISDNPFNDNAITGSFAFKNGKVFMKIAKELIRRGITVKGEYYIDSMINIANDLGYKVVAFPVTYIGWGVPEDYEEYIYWENIFKGGNYQKEKNNADYSFWYEYFNGKKN